MKYLRIKGWKNDHIDKKRPYCWSPLIGAAEKLVGQLAHDYVKVVFYYPFCVHDLRTFQASTALTDCSSECQIFYMPLIWSRFENARSICWTPDFLVGYCPSMKLDLLCDRANANLSTQMIYLPIENLSRCLLPLSGIHSLNYVLRRPFSDANPPSAPSSQR